MSDPLVLMTVEDNIAVISLDRPNAKNALSIALTDQLAEFLDQAEADPDVKVIMLTGTGDHFAAGADVKEMLPLTLTDVHLKDFAGCCTRLAEVTKPVVAVVEGYALGGGCELVEMCDIVLASETARFGHPEITLATMSGAGGTQRLPRVVGKHVAMDLLLTGRLITAQEALQVGLVSRIFTPDQLQKNAFDVCRKIAGLSAPVVKMVKHAVNQGLNDSLVSGLALERKQFHLTFGLADRIEGMKAFVERRPPEFKDR
jgi:enoyl-CoA hydratase